MNLLSVIWGWLSDPENQKTLAFIGGGLAIAIGGVWTAYLHFSKKPEEKPSPKVIASKGGVAAGENVSANASGSGVAFVNTGDGNVINIGITLEQYEAGLKRKEQETRAELAQASAADKEKIALLEKQLAGIQDKLKNPASALEDYKAKLAQAYKAFNDLKREVLPEQIKQAQDALTKGETATAERLFTQVLTRGTENAAEAAYQLGELAYGRIDYQTADRYYRQAVALQPGNPHYLNQAGFIAYTVGRYSEAEPLLQRSLAIWEKAIGPDHPLVTTSLNNLALLYHAQGQYAKAEPLYQRALAAWETALGPEHHNVATIVNNLSELYRAEAEYAKAEPLYQRALAIREKALGPEHPDVAQSLNNLAGLYKAQGLYAKAEPLYQRALAIREKALGPEHPDVAQSLNNLAGLYHAQGQYAKAEPLYQRALAVWETALGPDHPDVAASVNNLAALYHAQGQYAKAEPLYQRALAVWETALGPEHPNVARASTTSRRCIRRKAHMPRPSRSTSAPSPFGRRPLAQTIPMWRRAFGTTRPYLGSSIAQ